MSEYIAKMMKRYSCSDFKEYETALREVIQECALLALWRTKFFEKAAFYGGTALRILYGLNRFSEDLDFSLLVRDDHFQLGDYESAIERELNGLGMQVSFQVENKKAVTSVQSAFLKTGTLFHLMKIQVPSHLFLGKHPDMQLKIKMEVDTNPPGEFNTEFIDLVEPLPFSVRTFSLPDLFAGKMHALLFREWKTRVKGRDWYDFVWYVGRKIPLHLTHFEARLCQTGQWMRGEPLTVNKFLKMFDERVGRLDVKRAQEDLLPFIEDPRVLDDWSSEYFKRVGRRIEFIPRKRENSVVYRRDESLPARL